MTDLITIALSHLALGDFIFSVCFRGFRLRNRRNNFGFHVKTVCALP